MVKDAEAHAEDDRKLIETGRRRATSLDALVHSVKKSLAEYGDKVGADEKAKIEAALKDAEDAAEEQDATRTRSKRKTQALAQGGAEARREDVRRGAGEARRRSRRRAPAAARSGGAAKKDDGKVVDAEFTEVKDKK